MEKVRLRCFNEPDHVAFDVPLPDYTLLYNLPTAHNPYTWCTSAFTSKSAGLPTAATVAIAIALDAMRKGAGISALSRHAATTSSYSALSSSISASQLTTLQTSLASFKSALLAFAAAHRADIRADPAFRHQFQKMCAAIGVDPLAAAGSSHGALGKGVGGWWADALGLGEWQYELAVQVVDVCISTRARNGGMIAVDELVRRVTAMRSGGGGESEAEAAGGMVASEDVLRSLALLRPLCAGYATQNIGGTTYVRSIPRELDTDQSLLLVLAAETGGRLSEDRVKAQTGWPDVRVRTVLDDCVMREGLGWIDEQAPGGRDVWLIAAVDMGDAGWATDAAAQRRP
nr:RNA polymerase II transcription factor complex subunit [Naematelia aurantialba]